MIFDENVSLEGEKGPTIAKFFLAIHFLFD